MKTCSDTEMIGYLLWFVGLMINDIENMRKKHPNWKPEMSSTERIKGKLEEMGIDVDGLMTIITSDPILTIEPFIEIGKREEGRW